MAHWQNWKSQSHNWNYATLYPWSDDIFFIAFHLLSCIHECFTTWNILPTAVTAHWEYMVHKLGSTMITKWQRIVLMHCLLPPIDAYCYHGNRNIDVALIWIIVGTCGKSALVACIARWKFINALKNPLKQQICVRKYVFEN